MQSEEKKLDTKQTTPPQYEDRPKTAPTMYAASGHSSSAQKVFGLVFLCFVASFLGSWLLIGSGLVRPNIFQTSQESRTQTVMQEGEVIADVAKKVTPSVVSIVTQSQVQGTFRSFQQEGAGTGVIVSADGYVLTNKHVIPQGATNVSVVQSDGTVHDDVSVIGRDPLNDIAFLKINGASNLPVVTIGDSSQMEIGQKVIAIGNALGEFPNTVTAGIISGVSRPITAGSGNEVEQLENLFQTDTAINPGNSGGPLLNLSGEVIGINTAIAEEAEGIGFAIPIDTVKGVLKTVLQNGQVKRAYLGVRYMTINAEVANQYDLSVKKGALLRSSDDQNAVVAGSPAAKAGLKENDVITKVNNDQVDALTLAGLLAQYVPGDTVTLTVLRDGKSQEIRVTLAELDQ